MPPKTLIGLGFFVVLFASQPSLFHKTHSERKAETPRFVGHQECLQIEQRQTVGAHTKGGQPEPRH